VGYAKAGKIYAKLFEEHSYEVRDGWVFLQWVAILWC
jgi:hypothetical protein